MARYEFAWDPTYRIAAAAFGVRPSTAWVEVDGEALRVRFGPWRVVTDLANVAGCQVTGPYTLVRTIGPARLSLADRGITFATNGARGLCIRMVRPVAGIDRVGVIRHPGVTVTVADIDGLAAALGRRP